MASPQIRADHEQLSQIAKNFSREAANISRMLQRIKQQRDTLQGGDWIGEGAEAFYSEMQSEVLPALKRLSSAFEVSGRVTRQISQIMLQAEEDVARLFKGNGSAAGLGGAVGQALAGAIGEQAGGFGGNPLLVRDPAGLFSDAYMRGLIGSQFQGAGGRLGEVMNGLLQNPTGDELDGWLNELADLRGRPVTEIRIEFERYQEAVAQRDAAETETPESLSGGGHPSFMGSNTQMRYGSVVGDALGVDPVFGAMLNPTGGLVGPGNWAIAGDDTAVGYHGVVHDAAGYLSTYHDAGPGYDYLGTEGRDTSSPLSGQRDGIAYWRDATGGPSPISAPAEWVMRGVVGGIDFGSAVIQGAGSIF
jgi:WXG100 family type VII secretion target